VPGPNEPAAGGRISIWGGGTVDKLVWDPARERGKKSVRLERVAVPLNSLAVEGGPAGNVPPIFVRCHNLKTGDVRKGHGRTAGEGPLTSMRVLAVQESRGESLTVEKYF